MQRDRTLDGLLGLDGQVYVIDAQAGLAVRFDVHPSVATERNPHGIDYQMSLYGPTGQRLVGFENSQQMRTGTFDHMQRLRSVRAHAYRDAAALVEDFWDEVDAWLRARAESP